MLNWYRTYHCHPGSEEDEDERQDYKGLLNKRLDIVTACTNTNNNQQLKSEQGET